MSFDLGDVVPLSVTVTLPSGQEQDAGEVNLTVTLPDGTTSLVGPISSTTAGVYDHDYTTVQAGRHNVRWLASGANASAYSDAFDVTPADDGDFISLADALQHLKKSSTTPDGEKLRGFVSAACRMITDRMGQVSPTTVVHEAARCGDTIILPRRPIIAVASVERLPGLVPIPQADRATGVAGWYLKSTEGVLAMSSGWFGDARVTYRAGRTPLPPNFRLAGLELVAHLWRTSQLNSGGGRPSVGTDEVLIPGTTFALPYNVRQLLGLDRLPRDEVLVG